MLIRYKNNAKSDDIHVEPFGSKNASMFSILSAVARPGSTTLNGIPIGLKDVDVCIDIARSVRAQVRVEGDSIHIPEGKPQWQNIDFSACGKIRHALLIMPLVAISLGKVKFPIPGGCAINGSRPFDYHCLLWSYFGIDSEIINGFVFLHYKYSDRFNEINLPYPSVGASVAAALLATSTGHVFTINNIAKEPEVDFFISLLEEMGMVSNIEERSLTILSTWNNTSKVISIPPDRINIVTNCIAAAICRRSVIIPAKTIQTIQREIEILKLIGVDFYNDNSNENIIVDAQVIDENSSIHLKAECYPGIATDCQPLFAALACTLLGQSSITDTVYPQRFEYIQSFRSLGINCKLLENTCIITGTKMFGSGEFGTNDIRSTMAVALLGLVSEHGIVLTTPQQLYRGYLNPIYILSAFAEIIV
jgi:UDP-N-acetylglucosamine 1-carboxyvinyltransferase